MVGLADAGTVDEVFGGFALGNAALGTIDVPIDADTLHSVELLKLSAGLADAVDQVFVADLALALLQLDIEDGILRASGDELAETAGAQVSIVIAFADVLALDELGVGVVSANHEVAGAAVGVPEMVLVADALGTIGGSD